MSQGSEAVGSPAGTMSPEMALDDLRVVEMGQLIAGPFCGQLLGDLGAEVIKVEPPGIGDPMRLWGLQDDSDDSLTWPVIARNKKSLTMDLRTDGGQRVARRLLATSDVLVENFRPGTLERWNLSPETLWRENPGLIIVRVTGFGQTGPYAPRAGFGSIGEAMGGLRYITGEADRPPARVGVSMGDSLAGTFAAIGTLGALHARARTGRGQIVDVAIYESVLALMEGAVTEWDVLQHQRTRTGAILPGVSPSNVYGTAEDGEILIGANHDAVFRRLCSVMDQPELGADPRFATHQARAHHQQELDKLIGEWSAQLPMDEALALLHAQGVPAGKVYQSKDMFSDEHFAAREAIVRVANTSGRTLAMQNVAPRLLGTPGGVRWAGPSLGEHTEELLQQLGLSAAEIAQLTEAGVV